MSGEPRALDERAQRLLTAALDGELEPAERGELERVLREDPAARREWERMNRVKEVTRTMTYREPPDHIWGAYWTSVYNRLERGAGWILLSVGALIILGFVAWGLADALLEDGEASPLLRFGIFAALLGTGVLLVSALRQRLFARRHERYKEVER